MNLKQKLTALLLLAVGAVTQLNAQTAVTAGSQVTDASSIVSGKAYVLQSQATGTGDVPYINDNGDDYDIPMSNVCNESSVYYLISNGDGTWKIKNYYTNHFWGVPVYNQPLASVEDEALAGAWSLNFSNGIAYPSAPDADKTVRGLDRSSNKLWGFTTGTGVTKQVKIYEVGPTEKGLKKPIDIVSGWYLIKWVDINDDTNTNYANADVSGKYVKNYAQDVTVNSNNYPLYLDNAPTGTDGIALSLVYFEKEGSESGRGVDGYLRSANGHYVRQTGAASNSKAEKNYIIYRSSSTPNYSVVTSEYTGTRYSLIPCGKDATPYIGQTAKDIFPVAQFYTVDFSLYGLQPWSVEFDGEENAQVTYTGSNIYGLTSVYNGGTLFFDNGVTPSASDFSAPTRWGFSPDIEVDATSHTIKVTYIDIHKVYTINNTNSGRGALIYNPENPNYVWSSGKSGTFNASNANSQWVIIPTETTGQFYLYNVGADKFAIPTGIAQSTSNSWVFSDDAVAVIFEAQGDGTKKIKMASTPVSGTNAAYMAVSNNYTGPIINYNDAGGNFTITKVDGDASEAANAAVAKLIKNQTALTSFPQATGWYAIQIKSKTGAASYAGRYLYTANSLYNDLYPLTFTGAVDVQPAITDPTFFTHIEHTNWDVNTWQLPDGRYLVLNASSKFPTASATPGNVICGYSNGNYFKTSGNWYADPYNSNANYYMGETTSMRTAYTVYPIDLEAAGLVAWQVICDDATESSLISCTRSDVSGLTSVYKNGYFFLPTGVTPEAGDFELDGATSVTVDTSAKTITLAYNPNLAIVEDGVTVEQGWQTAGRGGEVMLLRVTAQPFKDATGTTLTVSLKDGSEANISALTLYEADSSSPEIYSTGSGAPTKMVVATASISGSTATFDIGSLAAGTHYYWIGATVKSDATLGAVLDAAVTGLTYTCNENETVLDLTSVGNPADRGAMVFNVHSYPFLPRDNGSRVYRIPAMVVANDGSIVVACDKRYERHTDIGGGHVIDIVVRRSTDGGRTWGEPVVVAKGDNSNDLTCGYGDPTLLKLANGTLVCTSCVGNLGFGKGLVRFMVSKSADNGQSWSEPVDVVTAGTLTIKPSIGDFFITSGHGILTNDGVMMYLVVSKLNGANTNFVIYSTDGGEHWTIDDTVVYNRGDEAKLAQLNDGTLIASIRQGEERGFNFGSYTKNDDGTLSFTWGEQYQNTQLHNGGAANNQDIFYYQRETVTGNTDVIFHSMTTGQHANLKLYYSTDKGANWTEFLTVQTKGTRYVTMEHSGSEENPGSLYLFFEDQSLNNSGDYTDYNHYPLNFLEITREQLESLIPTLNNIAISSEDLKIADGTNTNGPASYGDANSGGVASVTFKNTWTSNATSGTTGLTLSAAHAAFAEETSYSDYKCLGIKPSAGNATDVITITAPAGYIIKGYSLNAGYWTNSENYTLTASEGTGTLTCTTSEAPANSSANLEVTNIYKKSTSFTVKSNQATNNRCLMIKTFIVELTQEYPVKLNTVGSASYATLYLPFDVKTDANTKAYVIKAVGTDYASLTELEDGEIAANTAVVLINETSDAAAFTVASGVLTQQVTEDANLLKGTLVSKSLDLSDASNNYSLGRFDGEIGFYKFSGGTITLGANKAYLEVPAGGSVKGFTFDFDDDATSIQNSKFKIQNEEAPIYNLAGQRLSKPVKGINIVGGRKVLK